MKCSLWLYSRQRENTFEKQTYDQPELAATAGNLSQYKEPSALMRKHMKLKELIDHACLYSQCLLDYWLELYQSSKKMYLQIQHFLGHMCETAL